MPAMPPITLRVGKCACHLLLYKRTWYAQNLILSLVPQIPGMHQAAVSFLSGLVYDVPIRVIFSSYHHYNSSSIYLVSYTWHPFFFTVSFITHGAHSYDIWFDIYHTYLMHVQQAPNQRQVSQEEGNANEVSVVDIQFSNLIPESFTSDIRQSYLYRARVRCLHITYSSASQ